MATVQPMLGGSFMKATVYKLEVSIIDFDELGEKEIKDVLENAPYPNHCISPKVRKIEGREIDWFDEHPLNQRSTSNQAFAELFAAT